MKTVNLKILYTASVLVVGHVLVYMGITPPILAHERYGETMAYFPSVFEMMVVITL